MIISNIEIMGLESSIKASKYPMSVDIGSLTPEITPTVRKLFSSPEGQGHSQALTGIVVNFDLTMSIKAWYEAERYRFLYFVSSQSLMHRVSKFNIDEQCNEYVTKNTLNEVERLLDIYNSTKSEEDYLTLLYNIPTGFKFTARMTTNYRQLKTIYLQRKQHRLPEWREFCRCIRELPHFAELCLGEIE